MGEAREITEVNLAGDVTMPMIGFGTWQLRGKRAYEAIRYALEVGYRHVDTATMYRNEAEVGRAVRDSTGLEREDVFITTKLLGSDVGRERAAIEASLRAMQTSYVDLWLVHWPPGPADLVRVWQEFIAVRDEGLARAIGVSNYSTGQIDQLIDATGERPSVNQIPYGLRRHDPKLLSAMRERGVIVEGYSPLKNTNLRDPTLAEIAARHRVTPAQVVLRWHIQHGIPVIPKSGDSERIAANFAVFGFSLSRDDMALLDSRSSR